MLPEHLKMCLALCGRDDQRGEVAKHVQIVQRTAAITAHIETIGLEVEGWWVKPLLEQRATVGTTISIAVGTTSIATVAEGWSTAASVERCAGRDARDDGAPMYCYESSHCGDDGVLRCELHDGVHVHLRDR